MANKSKVRTVAKAYLFICYGLALAAVLTFGGAEGGPELPTVAFGFATLPSSALILWLGADIRNNWLIFLSLILMPVLNLSL